MLRICVIAGISLVLLGTGFYILNRRGKFGREKAISLENHYVLWVLISAFILRAVLAVKSQGHTYDINCFLSWSSHLYSDGIGNFYAGDFFSDYPPGYLYILYIIGFIRHIFGLTGVDGLSLFLIKLPAMLCDIFAGYFIYKSAKDKMSFTGVLFCLLVYLFLPGVYFDSSVWGQVDSVYTIMLLLMCEGIAKKKLYISYLSFGIGILIKPQMLFFAPILVLAVVDQVFLKDFSWKKFFINLGCGLAAIGIMLLFTLPFGFNLVLSQYMETIASYPYATINAYNFWAMLGLNWSPNSQAFWGLGIGNWGTVFLVISCILIFLMWIFAKKRDASLYYFLAGTLMLLIFTFSTHMHERYLFPAMAMFLLAFVHGKRKLDFYVFMAVGTLVYMNTAHVLYFYDAENFSRKAPVPMVLGAVEVICALSVAGYGFIREKVGKCKEAGGQRAEERCRINKIKFNNISNNKFKEGIKSVSEGTSARGLNKKEWIFLAILIAVYSIIAFYDLGDMKAPQTFYIWDEKNIEESAETTENKTYAGDTENAENTKDNCIVLDLGENTNISSIAWYLGNYEERQFYIEASKDGERFYIVDELLMDSVFCWEEHDIDMNGRFIRLTPLDDKYSIGELVLLDSAGNIKKVSNVSDYPELFDEEELFPSEFTYRNGTYFDEIYHARTAYEYIHGLYSYENTHPPLGKILIALGIKIFGMCPFGWRFMGTLFGVLMIPLFYFFVRQILINHLGQMPENHISNMPNTNIIQTHKNQTFIAMTATILFSFDFMHFTQTRIATIDVFVTFFIMAAYYFMYRYACMDFYEDGLKRTLVPLGFSGLFMGLSIASKWTGIYAGVGLAVIFFGTVIFRTREYFCAVKMLREAEYGKNANEGAANKNAANRKTVYMKNANRKTVNMKTVNMKTVNMKNANGLSYEKVCGSYQRNLTVTLTFCLLFFILVPAVIYTLSYIPFNDGKDWGMIPAMLHNQETMFNYHSGLVAEHYYSSKWYQWPVIFKPILYYCTARADGLSEGISAMGNPAVWWMGIPAFFYTLYLGIRRKDRTALFLAVSFLAQYVPWMFVSRLTFIYHYFPSVPFLVMMIAYCGEKMLKAEQRIKYVWLFYVAMALGLFVMFYPVISGMPVSGEYVSNFLRWFDSWVLLL